MSVFSNADALAHELHAELKTVEERLAAKFREFYAALGGDATALEEEAAADAGQVAHDAQTAAAPVISEAEQDAATLTAAAVTSATNTLQATLAPVTLPEGSTVTVSGSAPAVDTQAKP